MYLATWATIIQFTMCIVMPLCTGLTYKAGDAVTGEKDEVGKIENYYGAMAVTGVRYLALICMLGGVTTVITGVFLMTPENANGRGSIRSHIPLVGEHLPAVPKPTAANDLPLVGDHVDSAMEATGETVGTGVNTVDGGVNTVGDGAKAVAGQ